MSDEREHPDCETGTEEASRRSLKPQERILVLDLWQRSGLTAREFSALVGISRKTLFDWKQRFDRHGPAE
jgi:transposase